MVLNRDAGFVREGQEVRVKLEAFPFTRYGVVPGRLTFLSRDAVQDENLGLVFPARVELQAFSINVDGHATPLTAGLAATAEIRTGPAPHHRIPPLAPAAARRGGWERAVTRSSSFARVGHLIRPFASRLGAFVLVFAALVAGACAQTAGTVPQPSDVSQRLIRPVVAGVTYDARGERVFTSLCHARLYDCDLAEISMRGAGSLRYLRAGGAQGYTQPTVSEDGRYLFAARAPRAQRPGQLDVDQELVRIDLTSDSEIVASPSGGFRYERLIALDGTSILVVQSYRSNATVRCRGDYCTDAARVVLFGEGRSHALPNVGTVGEVGPVSVSIIPLGADGVWIRAPTGEREAVGGTQARTMSTWLYDARTDQLSAQTSNVNEARHLFEAFANSHSSDVRWRWQQLYPGGGPLELRAFPANRDSSTGIEQVSLTAYGRGVRLTKRRSDDSVRLDVEVAENRGVSPWQSVHRVSVVYRLAN